MALREEFEGIGNWLFRWRSYLPLVLISLVLLALQHFGYPARSHKLDELWAVFCLVISVFGLAIRMYAVGSAPRGTSGRNVKEQRARVLNTTGLYSITRHPLYLGNFIIWLGIALSIRSWWLIGITLLIFWLYYEKIMFAEEEFLRREYGDTFLEWANRTPAFFPTKLRKWISPALPVSLRNALRREYSGFFAIISTFFILEVAEELIVNRKIKLDLMWVVLLVFGFVVYLTLMILKKKTNLLDVEGR